MRFILRKNKTSLDLAKSKEENETEAEEDNLQKNLNAEKNFSYQTIFLVTSTLDCIYLVFL